VGDSQAIRLHDKVIQETASDVDRSPHRQEEAPSLPVEALHSILRFDRSLGRCHSLDETLRATVGQGLGSFGARSAIVALLGYQMRLEHVQSSPDLQALRARCRGLPLDSSLPLAEAIRTGKAITGDETGRGTEGLPPEARASRWVVLPIAGGTGVIGALWLFLDVPPLRHEQALFATLIERLTAAIERARLLDSERRLRMRAELATGRLSRLQSLTTGLSSALEPVEVADAVMTYAAAELGAIGGTFYMLADDGLLHSVRTVGPKPRSGRDIRLENGSLSALGRGGVVLAPAERGFSDGKRDTIRALVPLTMRGEVRGAIELSFPQDLYPRSELRSFLGVLGSQCSDAMDRARLYRQRAHEAHVLQTSLLPPALPAIPWVDIGAVYRPFGDGTAVGGDFYDVYQLTDGTWAFGLGDVSGKGVEAAAITAMVRYTARAAALLGCGPAETLEILNRAMLAESVGGKFCTVVHGVIEPSPTSIGINMALGGHPRPLLVEGATGAVRPVGVPGTAIGCIPDPTLTETRIHLSDGDAVAFFTDGCIDFRTGGRTMTDEGPLLDALRGRPRDSAAALARRVEEAALEAKGGTSSDDIAVLVVRRRSNGEGND
jgi:GAF domain-containing protein